MVNVVYMCCIFQCCLRCASFQLVFVRRVAGTDGLWKRYFPRADESPPSSSCGSLQAL